jgi:predicted RNA-binding Zn-ribbon protein involved in translation (DUF1610 family)
LLRFSTLIPVNNPIWSGSSGDGDTTTCPKCGSGNVKLLEHMRQYNKKDDWYRCDRCGHLFTTPRKRT